jgi:hypothetical protein
MAAFIREHRTGKTLFDMVAGGLTSGKDHAKDAEEITPFAEAGVTWWMEPANLRTPVEMRERIRIGPPRV